jgi:diguanylate cyclase (GGDEF)-like protein
LDCALDPLTWLPNRELFRSRVDRFLACVQPPPVALLHIDLDRFDEVNELLGYETGDFVLREAAARIARTFPRGALLGHLGGDDFGALIEAVELAQATRCARLLLDACREPFVVECLALRLTVSVGIALRSSTATDAAALMARACDALYRAKVAGRDRCFPVRAPQHQLP